MRAILAGTFSTIHKGHYHLFKAALAFDELLIGLTTDTYCKNKKLLFSPFEKRKSNLIAFLSKLDKKLNYKIIPIDDEIGFAADVYADAIIVSFETEENAKKINAIRKQKNLKPLKIVSLPIVYAEDYIKISSQRILSGKIDINGKRLKPLKITVGSKNPTKINGVKLAAKKLFSKIKVEIESLETNSNVSEQPFELETVQGAINRAFSTFLASDCDFSVGLESGIFKMFNYYQDMAICAIFDGEKITIGNSMGFSMPLRSIKLLPNYKDLGAVMEAQTGIKDISKKGGAIEYLSSSLLNRTEMNTQAFLCAMIPRISESKMIFRYF